MNSEEVAILGGGVFGFSIAYHLAREGIRSWVIEADSIGSKASGKADGMIPDPVFSFFYAGSKYCAGGLKRLMVPLMAENYRRLQQFHSQLQEESGLDIQYASSPFLSCAMSEGEEKALSIIASEARKEGLEVKWISGDEARHLEDTISPEVRGAMVFHCSQVEPYRYTLALAQAAETMGATIKYGKVVGFKSKQSKVTSVLLSSGTEIGTEKVVIAMGPWSLQAVSWLGLKLPLTPFRAETLKMVATKCPKLQLAFMPPPVGDWPHVFMIISARVDGTLLVGYTEDRPKGWKDDEPDSWSDCPSAEMRKLMLEHAERFVPVLEDAMLVEHRAAVLANPPAEGMIVGPLPNWDNVYIAMTGDNGMCVSLEVGRIMADLVVGGDRANRAMEEINSVVPTRFIL